MARDDMGVPSGGMRRRRRWGTYLLIAMLICGGITAAGALRMAGVVAEAKRHCREYYRLEALSNSASPAILDPRTSVVEVSVGGKRIGSLPQLFAAPFGLTLESTESSDGSAFVMHDREREEITYSVGGRKLVISSYIVNPHSIESDVEMLLNASCLGEPLPISRSAKARILLRECLALRRELELAAVLSRTGVHLYADDLPAAGMYAIDVNGFTISLFLKERPDSPSSGSNTGAAQ